jgi:hypothetical protein
MTRLNARDNVLAVTVRAFNAHNVELVLGHFALFDYLSDVRDLRTRSVRPLDADSMPNWPLGVPLIRLTRDHCAWLLSSPSIQEHTSALRAEH